MGFSKRLVIYQKNSNRPIVLSDIIVEKSEQDFIRDLTLSFRNENSRVITVKTSRDIVIFDLSEIAGFMYTNRDNIQKRNFVPSKSAINQAVKPIVKKPEKVQTQPNIYESKLVIGDKKPWTGIF